MLEITPRNTFLNCPTLTHFDSLTIAQLSNNRLWQSSLTIDFDWRLWHVINIQLTADFDTTIRHYPATITVSMETTRVRRGMEWLDKHLLLMNRKLAIEKLWDWHSVRTCYSGLDGLKQGKADWLSFIRDLQVEQSTLEHWFSEIEQIRNDVVFFSRFKTKVQVAVYSQRAGEVEYPLLQLLENQTDLAWFSVSLCRDFQTDTESSEVFRNVNEYLTRLEAWVLGLEVSVVNSGCLDELVNSSLSRKREFGGVEIFTKGGPLVSAIQLQHTTLYLTFRHVNYNLEL